MSTSIIIDSDIGSDDYMAIAYLLSRPEITIEAITVVHGLTDVNLGARNTRKLLYLIHEAQVHHIPIYIGENDPIGEPRPFPDAWKHTSHTIFHSYYERRNLSKNSPDVKSIDQSVESELIVEGGPAAVDSTANNNEYLELLASIKDLEDAEFGDAVDFLAKRLSEADKPARIVALGPLTNIALALRKIAPIQSTTSTCDSTSPAMHEIVMMGGAVEVKGNIFYESVQDFNAEAEWNIFCDPVAANEVFSRQDIRKVMIGLDATNYVPMTEKFLQNLKTHEDTQTLTESGHFINHILMENLNYIDIGEYFAWDPLVAVYMTHSSVVDLRPAELIVHTELPGSIGRTQLISWVEDSKICVSSVSSSSLPQSAPQVSCCGHHLYVGVSANRELFEQAFLSAFIHDTEKTTAATLGHEGGASMYSYSVMATFLLVIPVVVLLIMRGRRVVKKK